MFVVFISGYVTRGTREFNCIKSLPGIAIIFSTFGLCEYLCARAAPRPPASMITTVLFFMKFLFRIVVKKSILYIEWFRNIFLFLKYFEKSYQKKSASVFTKKRSRFLN